MKGRCQRYTELCNRSGSPVLQPAHLQMYSANALEDYWEDASVSLRSFHSWEAPSSAWLEASAPDLRPNSQIAESKSSCDSDSRRIRPCRYSFDAIDSLGSVKGRRCFPPPLASCSTLSIKEGGRFVLKEMEADRPQGFFRAQRENGRLLLELVLPDESNDDRVSVTDEDCDDDDFGEFVDGEDEDAFSGTDCLSESSTGLCGQALQVELDAHDEGSSKRDQFRRSSIEEVIIREVFDGSCEGVNVNESDCAYQALLHGREALDSPTYPCDQLRDVESKTVELNLSTAWEILSEEEYLDRHVGQFVADSSVGTEQVDALGLQHQESLWDVNAANHALTSRKAWSSNQMCLHQSLINVRPALGLAMS